MVCILRSALVAGIVLLFPIVSHAAWTCYVVIDETTMPGCKITSGLCEHDDPFMWFQFLNIDCDPVGIRSGDGNVGESARGELEIGDTWIELFDDEGDGLLSGYRCGRGPRFDIAPGTTVTDCGLQIVNGTTGDDTFRFDASQTPIIFAGGPGNDDVTGSRFGDVLFGGPGHDNLDGGGGTDLILGGSGNDDLDGGGGNDLIFAGEGVDHCVGGAGDDTLFGGPGDDFLRGNHGDDFLEGGGGDDFLLAGPGNDDLDGGDGNDTLKGNGGDDFMQGGAGIDYLSAGGNNDEIDPGPGRDRVRGCGGDDRRIACDGGSDVVERDRSTTGRPDLCGIN